MVAIAAGPLVLAMVLAPVTALAAAQAARSWRRRQRRASWRLSAGGAGLVVVASALGLLAVVVVVSALVVLLVTAMALGRSATPRPQGHAAPVLTLLIATAFGLAGAALVLLRSDGFIAAFVLLTFVHVYDASAYIVGTGAPAAWEGPAAGVASIAAVTLAIAAVLSPPFRGATPLLFGVLAAALTPLGPLAASELLGDQRARVPAVRRLDSLLVVGPVWALAAALVLD